MKDMKYHLADVVEQLLREDFDRKLPGETTGVRLTRVTPLVLEVKVTQANGPRYFNVRVSEMM